MSNYATQKSCVTPASCQPTGYLIKPRAMPLSSLELYQLLREGFLLDHVMNMVLSSPLYSSAKVINKILGNSSRSIRRRTRLGEPVRLNAGQSTVAFQYAEALECAVAVFGSQRGAEEWLERPCRYLEGYIPLDLIGDWWGFQAVREYLERIEFGVYH